MSSRRGFFARGNGVLQVKENHVRLRACRLLEKGEVRCRHGQLRALKACSGGSMTVALMGGLCSFNLETAVGRARAGRDAVRGQGTTTLRARARKEEQRRQSAAAWPARVCSAFTQEVMNIVGGNVCIHAVSPAESSGQLRFLGS